jgi:hypothetical protein
MFQEAADRLFEEFLEKGSFRGGDGPRGSVSDVNIPSSRGFDRRRPP